jgi:hypothetical protein
MEFEANDTLSFLDDLFMMRRPKLATKVTTGDEEYTALEAVTRQPVGTDQTA